MQAPRAEGVSAPPQRDQATDCVALAATAFVALAAGKLRWPAKTDVARRRAWLLFWLALYAARAVVAGGVWRRAALLLLLLLVARNKQDGVLPSLHPVLVVATQDELPPGGGDDQVSAGLQRDGRGLQQWKSTAWSMLSSRMVLRTCMVGRLHTVPCGRPPLRTPP